MFLLVRKIVDDKLKYIMSCVWMIRTGCVGGIVRSCHCLSLGGIIHSRVMLEMQSESNSITVINFPILFL